MSYCGPCRRHLNGAFSCPGCGRPASALDQPPGALPEDGPATAPYSALPVPRARNRADGRAAERARRGNRSRRVAVLTAAGLVLGGMGAVALGSTQGSGATPTTDGPVRPQPSMPAVSTALPPSEHPTSAPPTSARPSRTSARPSATTSSSAAPTAPSTTATAPAPASGTPTAPPSATKPPSPSPTCTPVLFWCR